MPLTENLRKILEAEMFAQCQRAMNSTVRVIFQGLPESTLNNLLTSFVDTNGLKLSGLPPIPVFMVDNGTSGGPEDGNSGKCNNSYLVAYRGGSHMIALLPAGESLNLSIENSVRFFGLDSNTISGKQRLIDDRFVQDLIEVIKPSGIDDDIWNQLKEFSFSAINERKIFGEKDNDQSLPWQLINSLFEIDASCEDFIQRFTCLCGFPKAPKNYKTIKSLKKDSEKSLKSLSDFLQHHGFNSGKEILISESDSEYHEFIEDFFNHVKVKCQSVPEFSEAPSIYYSIENLAGHAIPDWWAGLDFETWEELIDGTTQQKPEDVFDVICINSCYPNITGMPIVVQDIPKIESNLKIAEGPDNLEIYTGGGKAAKKIDEFDIPGSWSPTELKRQKKSTQYRFHGGDLFKNKQLRITSLNHLESGCIVGCPAAKKVIFPKKIKKKAGSNITYETEILLKSSGKFQIELYLGEVVSVTGTAIKTTQGSGDREEEIVTQIGDYKWGFWGSTDDQDSYQVSIKGAQIGDYDLKINLTSPDSEPQGVENEFEKLVLENTLGNNKSIQVEPRWNKRIYGLERWILDDPFSCFPIIISNDYSENWEKPDWKNKPILSKMSLNNDLRPDFDEWEVPKNFIESRESLVQCIKDRMESDHPIIEEFFFRSAAQDEDFKEKVLSHLKIYIDWLNKDFQSAIISDACFIIPPEPGSRSLSIEPEAMLISPVHPVKLAWHFIAHGILGESLSERKPCPAASILNPYSVPDYIEVPCRRPDNTMETIHFISIKSNSPYWSVLWNGKQLANLNGGTFSKIWGDDFGICIDGASTGFSTAQVQRALSDAQNIMSAKNALRVSITSDTLGDSSCNEGIISWCENNLGSSTEDIWNLESQKKVKIFDQREESQLRPSPAIISNLTKETNAAVSWYSKHDEHESDLSIIAHLGQENPTLQQCDVPSAVAPGGMFRTRIRRHVGVDESKKSIMESRIGKFWQNSSKKEQDLSNTLNEAIQLVEKGNGDNRGCYVFTPAMLTVSEQFEKAKYCAMSSSTIDSACFFGKHSDAYLWDYDLPSYSQISGENSGFYMLVRENPTMVTAVENAICTYGPSGSTFDKNEVKKILYEIAKRGMPTLKRLAAGGSSALGEVGVFIALRMLQDSFVSGKKPGCIIPVNTSKDKISYISLIIPVDPFVSQIDSLRSSANSQVYSNQRPDLLACVIAINEFEEPIKLKITPLEIKARSKEMAPSERKSAIKQASTFSKFIREILVENKMESSLWGFAGKELLSSWLSFGFRIYGVLEEFNSKGKKALADLQSKTLGMLFADLLEIQVDSRGRLIVVDQSHESKPTDDDGDGFWETIVIKSSDAFNVLSNNHEGFVKSVSEKLDKYWDLRPDLYIKKPMEETIVEDTEDNGTKNSLSESKIEISSINPNINGLNKQPDNDTNLEGIKFPVGNTVGTFSESSRYFWPSNTSLNQLNIGVVGDLGTGKTQLVQALIYRLASAANKNRGQKPNILILDYKNDYSNDAFVKATGAKIIEPYDLPLNIFDTSTCTNQRKPWVERYKFFADLLLKIYPVIKGVQIQNIRNAVLTAYENAEAEGRKAPTVYEVFEIYGSIIKNPDSTLGVLTDLVDLDIFTPDPKKVIPFNKFLDGVVVINLWALGQDDKSKNLLVAILLNFFYEYMLQIKKKGYVGDDPQLRFVDSMLLVDEADNILQYEFDVLSKILLQGREFGVGVVLASQYLSHFRTKGTNYLEPLLTWFIHKVPNVIVKELESIGLTRIEKEIVEGIKKLDCHECLYKSLDVEGEFIKGIPFYKLNK